MIRGSHADIGLPIVLTILADIAIVLTFIGLLMKGTGDSLKSLWMKAPIIDALTNSGCTRQPVAWNAPGWLESLTE